MDEPASPDTWTSPALGRMVTDVQSRLEAATSPDELMASPPDELTAASPKAVTWQVRRRQPTTPLTATSAPAADLHGQSAATPRMILTSLSPATRPTPQQTPIRLSRCPAC